MRELTALQRAPLSDIDAVMNALEVDGGVIVNGVLDKTELASLNDETSKIFDASQFCDGDFFGYRTKRIHGLVAKSPQCRALITKPQILEIMRRLLLPFCEKIQLNLTQGIQIWPGERAQFLHRDDAMFPAPLRGCEFMANVMWACSDFTKENGATLLAPGSHKWTDIARRPVQSEITQAEMNAGDILIYRGSVIHAGGENRSLAPRTGLAMGYCLGWLRQYENQYLVAPPNVAKNFPENLQDLLGYTVHRPNLGMYEGNEPKIMFDDSRPEQLTTHDWLTNLQTENIRKHYNEDKVS